MTIERTILHNLFNDDTFSTKVLPYIQEEYFPSLAERLIYSEIKSFYNKYSALPTQEAIRIEIDGTKGLDQKVVDDAFVILDELKQPVDKPNDSWLLDTTEKWCQDKKFWLAMGESIEIMKNPNHDKKKGTIIDLLSEAFALTFDPHIGHDYLEDVDAQFEYYHRKEERLPFDIELLNKITCNGIPTKTLNIIIAGVHVGKTLMLCHLASSYLVQGKNVLYITLEVSQEEITRRVDANLLDINIGELLNVPEFIYKPRTQKLRDKTTGKLIVKEYPPATVGSNHFKALLNDLYLKRGFRPDVVCIDYLNNCVSSRIKNASLYEMVKAISEEVRGIAVEYKTRVWTATQFNRTGFKSTDPGMDDSSESWGIPMTADFMIAALQPEALKNLGQYCIKQLKNRYGDLSLCEKFIIGVDKLKMRLYDAEQSAQEDIVRPSSNTSSYGGANLNKFAGLKII
jgi:archaellum biogenesis ATPase FlaH